MIGALLGMAMTVAGVDDATFESKVRPMLAGTCVRCHGPRKASGGLRLDSREAVIRGGESGPAAEPGHPETSLLLQAVERLDDLAPMPPDKPLKAESVADLRRWIADGMPWPDSGPPILAARHWAFEPLKVGEPPGPGGHPVDAFLDAELREKGLTPVAPADRRTWVRRATFDLTGLPPTPEEVEAFLADTSPSAFEAVVDRLLGSRQYGEKWGRAWLDIAHYADTAGETADLPAPEAWRYRNYVIDAIAADKPYDQFLREQVAGDILARELPDDAPPSRFAELMTATGYLAVARRFGFDIAKDHHLTIDDTVDTLSKGILGLTIGCARCHDHKYDPITANDYYALYGIFESTRYPFSGCEKQPVPRDNVMLLSEAEYRRGLGPLEERVAGAQKALADAEGAVQSRVALGKKTLASGEIPNGGEQDFATADDSECLKAVAVHAREMIQLAVSPRTGYGADSTLVSLTITEQGGKGRAWDVTVDMLADPFQNGDGFRHDDGHGNKGVWQFWDESTTPRLLTEFNRDAERTKGLQSWRGPEPTPCLFANANDQAVAFVTVKQPARSLALHPGPRGSVVLAWESPIEGTVSIHGRVADIDASGGDGVGWSLAIGPGLGEALASTVAPTRTLAAAIVARDAFDGSVPRAYAVAEGRAHDARLQVKGDPETLGPEVPRRFVEVLGGQAISPGGGSGRRDLANWLGEPANPLTPRVIVNRVWQGHFGNGLVRTPDNFGVRGEPPSHPDLLDWLASRFIRDGWSLKKLHRLIMTSAAYRRSVAEDPKNDKIDHDNLTLWRFERRRLAAEEIRDAMLAVSGDLDATPGGPHPFPEPKTWGFTQHNPFTAVYDHDRRSVYLMTQRIRRHPFLALFDGPDPNSCTGRRDSTTVPTQALFYMNDPFVHARAEGLARRLAALPDDPARLDRADRLLFGRPPGDREATIARRFLAEFEEGPASKSTEDRRRDAWASWLRVLLSSNEFTYLE